MLLATGCSPVAPDPHAQSALAAFDLAGRVELATYAIKDAAGDRMKEIAKTATVSLIRSDNGQTVSSALTNDKGVFSLQFGAGFTPVPDQPYILEAVKGLKMSDAGDPNAVGAAAARLRTLIAWNAGWRSFRNATPGPIAISIGTTTLALMAHASSLDAAGQLRLIGSLGAGDALSLPGGLPAQFTPERFDKAWAAVRDALGSGQDPVAAVALPAAGQIGSSLNRTGPPLGVSRAAPGSLEPGGSITFYGRGFSKVANENVLWVRSFTIERDAVISASAVAADGTWARFDAPGSLPVPGPMSRYAIEVRQASGLGQTFYDVPGDLARPAVRQGVVTVLAGDAAAGGAWREGTFDRARFYGPSDLELDAAGNLYVCEHWFGNRIRLLANRSGTFWGQPVQAGTVATVVGTGYGWNLPRASRYNGDSLDVLTTNLSLPWSITFDPQENLLITDYDAGALFRVAARADGNLYGTAVLANKVTTLGIRRGSWGARCIVTDRQGNLYYLDWGDRVIRFIPKLAGTYWGQTMVANTSYDLTGSVGSANTFSLDRDGNLLVTLGCQIFIFAPVAGEFYGVTVAARSWQALVGTGPCAFGGDGSPAGSALLNNYSGLAHDTAGNLWLADNVNHRVRVVAARDGSVAVAVRGASDAPVAGAATRKGYIYSFLGTNAAGAALPGQTAAGAALNTPYSVTMDPADGLYVADFYNNRIVYVSTR